MQELVRLEHFKGHSCGLSRADGNNSGSDAVCPEFPKYSVFLFTSRLATLRVAGCTYTLPPSPAAPSVQNLSAASDRKITQITLSLNGASLVP